MMSNPLPALQSLICAKARSIKVQLRCGLVSVRKLKTEKPQKMGYDHYQTDISTTSAKIRTWTFKNRSFLKEIPGFDPPIGI